MSVNIIFQENVACYAIKDLKTLKLLKFLCCKSVLSAVFILCDTAFISHSF